MANKSTIRLHTRISSVLLHVYYINSRIVAKSFPQSRKFGKVGGLGQLQTRRVVVQITRITTAATSNNDKRFDTATATVTAALGRAADAAVSWTASSRAPQRLQLLFYIAIIYQVVG